MASVDDLIKRLEAMHEEARNRNIPTLPAGETRSIYRNLAVTPEEHEARLRAKGVNVHPPGRYEPGTASLYATGGDYKLKNAGGQFVSPQDTFDPTQQSAEQLSQAGGGATDALNELKQAASSAAQEMKQDFGGGGPAWLPEKKPEIYDWSPGMGMGRVPQQPVPTADTADPFRVGGLPAEDRAKSALPSERNPPPEPFVGPPKPPEENKTWQQNLHASLASILGGGQHSESDEVADALNRVGGLGGGGGAPGGKGNAAAIGKAVGFGQDVMGAMAGDPMSMARAAQKVQEEVEGKMQAAKDTAMAMPRAFADAAGKEQVGQVGSSLMKGGADTMHGMSEMAKGPFGLDTPLSKVFEAGEKVFQLGKAAFDAFQAIRDFSTGLHEANMRFAEFSGEMAQVQAQQEVRQIQLDRERGNRRADDARALAESKNRLDRQLAPIEDWWAGLMMNLAITLNETIGKIAEFFGIKPDDDDGNDMQGLGREIIDAGARRNWVDEFGRWQQGPPRPQNVR